MINSPNAGWCTFKLGKFVGTPSYLTNVPLDLLKGFINYFNTGTIAIWFDEEGTEFTLVINPNSMFIISERIKTELVDLSEMKIENIAKELINDIKNDFEGWSKYITSDDGVKAQKIKLLKYTYELEKILKNKK